MNDLLTKSDIVHLRLQDALDAKFFDEDELKYLGIRDGMHLYLVEGEYDMILDARDLYDLADELETL